MIQFACQLDLSDCVKRSNAYFKDWVLNNNEKIPTSLRSTVICTSIRNSNTRENFELAFERFKSAKDNALKRDIIAGLSCTKDTWLLKYLVDSQLNNLDQAFDTLSTLNNVATKPNGHLISWNSLKENWNQIYQKYNPFFVVVCIRIFI